MGLFRKKETLNEQMLREAGLDRVVFNTPPPQPRPESEPQPAPPERPAPTPEPTVPAPATSGDASGWDVLTTVTAPGIRGHRLDFTTLPNGDLIVMSGNADDDLAPLADAVEEHLAPPYKATATRQDGDVWGVGAEKIEVAEIPFPDAEQLEFTQRDGIQRLLIDDGPTDVVLPEQILELGARAGANFSLSARRIDGDWWEVRVSKL